MAPNKDSLVRAEEFKRSSMGLKGCSGTLPDAWGWNASHSSGSGLERPEAELLLAKVDVAGSTPVSRSKPVAPRLRCDFSLRARPLRRSALRAGATWFG
jgi:hypothetical protein